MKCTGGNGDWQGIEPRTKPTPVREKREKKLRTKRKIIAAEKQRLKKRGGGN